MFSKSTSLFFVLAVFIILPNDVKLQNPLESFSENLMTSTATSAKTTLETAVSQKNIISQFYSKVKDFEDKIKSDVDALLDKINDNIAKEVAKQGGLTEKIYNCTMLQKSRIDAFATKTFNSLVGCATSKITQGFKDVTAIFTAVNGTILTVAGIPTRYNTSCSKVAKDTVKNLVCVSGVTIDITKDLTEYSVIIVAKVTDLAIIIAALPNYPTELATCLAAKTTTALASSVPIVLDVAKCTIFKK